MFHKVSSYSFVRFDGCAVFDHKIDADALEIGKARFDICFHGIHRLAAQTKEQADFVETLGNDGGVCFADTFV